MKKLSRRLFAAILISFVSVLCPESYSQDIITRPTKHKTDPKPAPPKKTEPQKTKPQNRKPTTGSINGHEWVDLGLSVKWATCNVGASSPSDYGDYLAWGETAPNSTNREENSITYGKSISELQQSGIVNSAGVLNRRYDAASVNWGSTWRMPTKAEFDELISKCTWTWTTQGGHSGYRVTGPNGNSIFVPAAGSRYGSSRNNAEEYGNLWSSSALDDANFACFLGFYSDNRRTGYNSRYCARSVRPVSE